MTFAKDFLFPFTHNNTLSFCITTILLGKKRNKIDLERRAFLKRALKEIELRQTNNRNLSAP